MSSQEKGQGEIAIFLTKQNDKKYELMYPAWIRGWGPRAVHPGCSLYQRPKEHQCQVPSSAQQDSGSPGPGSSPHSFRTWCQESEYLGNEAKANLGERSPSPGAPRNLGHHILENAEPTCNPQSSGLLSCPCSCSGRGRAADTGPKNGPAGGVLAFPCRWTK